MILTLIREQIRSQSRYAGAAFALVALATSLAAFVLISLATTHKESERLYELMVGEAEHHAWASVWTRGDPEDPTIGPLAASLTTEQLDDVVAEITADTSAPQLRLETFVWIEGEALAHKALAMDAVPATAFAQGTSPGSGQVALAGRLADALGLTVGDSVGFTPGPTEAPTLTLEVTGILREASPQATNFPPLILVSLAEGPLLFESAGYESATAEDGGRTTFMWVSLAWDGAVPEALAYSLDEQSMGSLGITGQWESLAVTALVLVLVTALVTAAAAGRSQGTARAQWVGTVRALGATRRDVVVATMLETVAVGALAGVAGLALGAGANVAIVRRQGGTFASDWPTFTASAVSLSMALALTVSVFLGATPAYWAARTTPAAALSPVGPTDVMPWRPRIDARLLVAVGVGAAALLLVSARAAGNGENWPALASLAVAAVFAVSIYLLVSRVMVRVVVALGGTLSHANHRVLVAAGSGLVQHPRHAASIGTAIAAGGIGTGAVVWWWVASPYGGGASPSPRPWSEVVESTGMAVLITAAVLGACALMVGLAIWIGRGRVAGDAAIYGALGLSRHDRQVSAMAQVALASFAGGAGGMVAGTALAALANAILAPSGTWNLPQGASAIDALGHGAVVWLGALLGIALVSLATSLAAARASDGKDPASLRRSASRAGTAS